MFVAMIYIIYKVFSFVYIYDTIQKDNRQKNFI